MRALLLFLLSVSAAAVFPPAALRVAVLQSGVDKIKDILLPVLNNYMAKGVKIPDQHIDTHVAEPLGHITLDLTDITITKFNLPTADLDFVPPSGVNVDFSGLTMSISMNYKWRKVHSPHASDHGSIVAVPNGGALNLDTSLSVTPAGLGLATVKSSTCTFTSFDLTFSGKVSWLYDLLTGLFKDKLKDTIQTAIASALSKAVTVDLDGALAKLPLSLDVGGGKSRLHVDTRCTDQTVLTSPSTALGIGNVLGVGNGMTNATCPATVPIAKLPVIAPTSGKASAMLQALVADAPINCALASDDVNGALHFHMLAGNTSAWKLIIPKLSKLYPDRPVRLDLTPMSVPNVSSVAGQGMVGSATFTTVQSVVLENGTLVFTDSLRLDIDFGFSLTVVTDPATGNATLTGNASGVEIKASVLVSKIGPIPTLGLGLVSKLLGPAAEALLNSLLAKGVPLPVSAVGIKLVEPQVEFFDHYFVISTSFDKAAPGAPTPAPAPGTPTPAPAAPTPAPAPTPNYSCDGKGTGHCYSDPFGAISDMSECATKCAKAPTPPAPTPPAPTPTPATGGGDYCGKSWDDANARCHAKCDGTDKACLVFAGEKCFSSACSKP